VIRRLPLVLLLTLLAVPAARVGAAEPGASGLELHPCPGGHDVLCGSLRVPFDRSEPGGRTLTVRFRIHRHTDTSKPALEPVLGIEGGPGLPSIPSAGTYGFMLGPLTERHDLIVIDAAPAAPR